MKIWKVVLVLLAIGAGFFAYKFFVGSDRPHNPRVFDPPAKTAWEPVGARTAGLHDYDIIPQPETFSAIHVGVNNSDSVWGAAAPMFELDWVAEPAYFVGNGPTLDNEGNLYFNPNLYHGERVIMVSLDAVTGERRWAIPAEHDREKTSPAFLLNDPDNPGSQIIYISSYTRIMAIRPDGSTVWTAKTGYTLPPITPDELSPTIMHLNYHLQTDSLVTVTSAGKLMAFDRKTGAPRSAGGQIPGAPAISGTGRQIPKRMLKRTDALMDEAFGKTETGRSMFSTIVNYIYGGGGVVTNYFSIAPDTGLIYVAATAEDAEDGTEDGRSEIGAIYVMDLIANEDGGLDFEIVNKATFQGGTGSTPAVSADGSRVYVSDNIGHVIALDAQLNEIWRTDVGEPLVGSVTVAPDNMEIYAVTQKDVFQLIDRGDHGEVMWAAELGGFDGYANGDVQSNVLTATPTANGVVIGIGGGKNFFTGNMMLHVGMGLVDRKTGALRYFAEGREDSIAMSIVGPDGSIYIGHSPIRRAVGKAMYPNLTPDLTGGVARYKPIRLDLLVRDAVCAAEARSANASTLDANTDAVAIANDVLQLQVLINQAEGAISIAVNDGDLTAEEAATLRTHLSVSMENLAGETLTQTTPRLAAACAMFD